MSTWRPKLNTPGARGLESVSAVLAQLPPDWRKLAGADVSALLNKAIAGFSEWKSGDAPIAALQRACGFAILSLELALSGQSPPATLAPATEEESTDYAAHRRGGRPKAKRHYPIARAPETQSEESVSA